MRAVNIVGGMVHVTTAQARTGNALFVGKFLVEGVQLLGQRANGGHLGSEVCDTLSHQTWVSIIPSDILLDMGNPYQTYRQA